MRAHLFAAAFCALTLSGCSIFSSKPALPRPAAIERGGEPNGGTDYAALVANAEIVYFPAERAASGARSEPSAMLLEGLRKNGAPFAIGWDFFDAGQQRLLDELRGKKGGAREAIIARLEIEGTGRAREHCRAVLRDERLVSLHHLALRCPPALLAKIDSRDRLTPEEEKEFARGYVLPPGGSEVYAERLAAGPPGSGRSYRAQMAAQQFAAERIVRHFRAAGMKSKLLVFLHGEDLEAGLGVPRYVAQKMDVRQLVLDWRGAAPVRPQLLTSRD